MVRSHPWAVCSHLACCHLQQRQSHSSTHWLLLSLSPCHPVTLSSQDYDMDEAYEGGGWGQEEEEQQQAEQEEDDGGAAAAAQGGFFGQQQLKQEAQAVFGAPAAAAAAPAPQPQRAPIPSPSAAGTAVGRPPRAAVPPPPRAAVRAANAAAAAAAAEASPARDVCYAVPAAHAPGESCCCTVTEYEFTCKASH